MTQSKTTTSETGPWVVKVQVGGQRSGMRWYALRSPERAGDYDLAAAYDVATWFDTHEEANAVAVALGGEARSLTGEFEADAAGTPGRFDTVHAGPWVVMRVRTVSAQGQPEEVVEYVTGQSPGHHLTGAWVAPDGTPWVRDLAAALQVGTQVEAARLARRVGGHPMTKGWAGRFDPESGRWSVCDTCGAPSQHVAHYENGSGREPRLLAEDWVCAANADHLAYDEYDAMGKMAKERDRKERERARRATYRNAVLAPWAREALDSDVKDVLAALHRMDVALHAERPRHAEDAGAASDFDNAVKALKETQEAVFKVMGAFGVDALVEGARAAHASRKGE